MPPAPEPTLCPNCGAPVTPEQRFCGNCGFALRRPCPVCGTENPVFFRFCSNCGTRLEAAPQPGPAAPPQPATSLPDERRWVTVVFADVSGFTSMAERMDPEDVRAFADRATQAFRAEIERFGGRALQVLGDEVMAVFGAPVAHEDDAERAVRAALAIRDLDLPAPSEEPVRVHVGVNSGEVLAGLLGPEGLREYRVAGDTVNTAARLRSAAPPGSVFVGEETHRATRRVVSYRQVAAVEAKGKDQPVTAWEALEALAVPGARPLGTAPLIGRSRELARLETVWGAATDERQPHLLTLLGEPGIGKTRLAAEFERRLAPDAAVWHGRCLPYGQASAYAPLAMALREGAGIPMAADAAAARTRLEAWVAEVLDPADRPAELARRLALLVGLEAAGDGAQEGAGTDWPESIPDEAVLHASVRRFLEAFSRRRPLCVIFDDIQWAADPLLDLIEAVAARAREAPLLLLALARPELLDRRPDWGRGVRSFTSIYLDPLDEAAERELISALAGERGVAPELAGQIHRRVSGNPLFAEEMVAMIAETGTNVRVPSLIKLLLAARLDALPPFERQALQLASVLGKVFWEGAVGALGIEEGAGELLDALVERDLLRPAPEAGLPGNPAYSFKHDLILDAAYDLLPRAERRRLHKLAADWLETVAGDGGASFPEQLAHHAVEAGQDERALAYLELAAERAFRTAAGRHAITLLSQAVELASRAGLSAHVTALRFRRAQIHNALAQWRQAIPDLEAVLAVTPSDRPEDRLAILLALADAKSYVRDLADMPRYHAEGLELVQRIDRDDVAASAIANLAITDVAEGDVLAGAEAYRRALERNHGAPLPFSPAVVMQPLLQYWLGHYDTAAGMVREATARVPEGPTAALYGLPILGMSLAGSGRYAEAEGAFREARRLAREQDLVPVLARTTSMSAGYHLDLFDYDAGEAWAEEARDLAYSANYLDPAVSSGIDLLLSYARRGEPGRAEDLLDRVAADVAAAAGWHGWLWKLRLAQARAELALSRHDYPAALELADAAVDQSRAHHRTKYHVLGLAVRARSLAALGRTAEAIETLRGAIDLARPVGDPALFLAAAVPLLGLAGDDALAAEARATVETITGALPDDEFRRRFAGSEAVQLVRRHNPA